jgi:hypothetical protein
LLAIQGACDCHRRSATLAGVMVSPGGVVAMVMMFVAGRLVSKI